jgi:simple sugar transport system substrate-binding protein
MIFTSPRPAEMHGSPTPMSKRTFLRSTALAGISGIVPSGAKAAWSWNQDPNRSHPRWNFAFVNHARTNPFFEATQNGIKDACELFGCEAQWMGSLNSDVNEMVSVFNSAVEAKVDAIAVSLIHETAFDEPVKRALRAGIPVFAYNSDVLPESQNERLAYIGQDLYAAGYMLGASVANLISPGKIVAFMATKHTLNLQPRADGLEGAIRDYVQVHRKKIELLKDKDGLPWFATGSDLDQQMQIIRSTCLLHPDVRALVGLDGGSTQSVAEVMLEFKLTEKGVRAAGFDLLPRTLELLAQDCLEFTIDQQPYLQGFLTTAEMFLFLMSGGTVGPADINTGRDVVTAKNIELYTRVSRYEGNSSDGWMVGPNPIRCIRRRRVGSTPEPRCALGQERTLDPRPETQ